MALHHLEWNAVVDLVKTRREQRSTEDDSVSSKNSGLNSAEAEGQIVFQGHWHLIPRREGDCDEPRGGMMRGIAESSGIEACAQRLSALCRRETEVNFGIA